MYLLFFEEQSHTKHCNSPSFTGCSRRWNYFAVSLSKTRFKKWSSLGAETVSLLSTCCNIIGQGMHWESGGLPGEIAVIPDHQHMVCLVCRGGSRPVAPSSSHDSELVEPKKLSKHFRNSPLNSVSGFHAVLNVVICLLISGQLIAIVDTLLVMHLKFAMGNKLCFVLLFDLSSTVARPTNCSCQPEN